MFRGNPEPSPPQLHRCWREGVETILFRSTVRRGGWEAPDTLLINEGDDIVQNRLGRALRRWFDSAPRHTLHS
jgi:hypothetical protein